MYFSLFVTLTNRKCRTRQGCIVGACFTRRRSNLLCACSYIRTFESGARRKASFLPCLARDAFRKAEKVVYSLAHSRTRRPTEGASSSSSSSLHSSAPRKREKVIVGVVVLHSIRSTVLCSDSAIHNGPLTHSLSGAYNVLFHRNVIDISCNGMMMTSQSRP